ncbi:MAG: hypothetical protein H8D56_25300 [Planctomycetes bacterium]|nr:hypothetical protein [Planctomycetota bacterium]MBL7145680.1 hypothetical protein [Phycisphaerae bacterium]
MNRRIILRKLHLPLVCIVLICGCTTQSQITKPHTLLFSPITPEYLQDTAADWKAASFDGFLLSGIMRNFSDDIWAADGDVTTRGENDKTFQRIKACNDKCLKQGITENFIKVAFYSHVPLWTDDAAWQKVNENFRQAALFAKQSGCRGIALDIEYVGEQYDLDWESYDYKGYTKDDLRAAAVKRGYGLTQAMLQSYPDMVFLKLPEGIYFYGPLATDLLVGMIRGMAEANAPGGLHLLTERSYQMVSTIGLIHYVHGLESDILKNLDQPAARYWRKNCSISLGGWPLGYYREIRDESGERLGYSGRVEKFGDKIVGSYADKTSNYPPEDFRNQYAGMLLTSKRYCWIYGHGATWWHFTDADVAKYGSVSNSALPVDERLNDYKAVLQEKWTPSGPLQQISRKVRQYKSGDFLQMLNFVKTFKIIGPFGSKNSDTFNRAFPPEENLDFNAAYPGSADDVRWQIASVDNKGYLDFLKIFSPSDWVCAYAYCKLISPKAGPAQLRLGTNDTVTLWLNGQKLLSKNIERSAAPDSDILPVNLRKGENTILIKVCNTEFNWGLYLRITDNSGQPIKNLKFCP